MNKTIYFLTLLFFIFNFSACSSDDSGSYGSSNKINPPAWILGTWKAKDSPIANLYTFSSNDIQHTIGGVTLSYKELLGYGGSYSQTSSETEFSFTMTDGVGSNTYKFKKISAIKMIHDGGLGDEDYEMWIEYERQ